MKKIFYLLSVTFLLLQSCSSDESSNNTNSSDKNTIPQLMTNSASAITPITGISGGNITSNGLLQ